jgi:hypothetical protein
LSGIPVNARIVVLTEGITDKRALESALRLLYPHLIEYYSFMDFENAKYGGGAGSLVVTLKAFAGAGIANRIIGVFDNDTAAQVALRGLSGMQLPPNIRFLTYPSLPLASSYPTIGPSGQVEVDVNGQAGSLELYFGEDVLRRPDGAMTPVKWKGFEDAVQSYQGELVDKVALQKAFAKKVDAATVDGKAFESQDWTGMRAILDALRAVFDP